MFVEHFSICGFEGDFINTQRFIEGSKSEIYDSSFKESEKPF